MKNFFLQDDVSTAKTSSVLFFISGVIAFIQPDILVVRTLASFFGAVAIAQIVLLGPQIMEDTIPEGKMSNVFRYMIMFGATAFILVIGAEFFFGVEIPESLDIIFLPVFFTWLIGITAGTYTAFSNKE